jgi:predicted Zn-dependent peptidase
MSLLQTVPEFHTLAPGVDLLILAEPRFKRCQVQVDFDRPLDARAPARTLLGQVLQQGTEVRRSRMQIARRLEDLYGASLALGGQRVAEAFRTTLQFSWVGERFVPVGEKVALPLLDLGREILEQPLRGADFGSFEPSVLERERAQLLRMIESFRDDRSSYAEEQFLLAMCQGEPFARSSWGSKQEVQALTAADLESAREDLLQHSHIRIMAVGPVDTDAIRSWFGEWLGSGGAYAQAQRQQPAEPIAIQPQQRRELREDMAVDQARFHFGFRVPRPQGSQATEALLMANNVLGGGINGRLFKIVREQRSQAYGIGSTIYTVKGLLTVSAGIDAQHYQEVRDEVSLQTRLLASEGPTEEELQMSKAAVLNGLSSIGDSAGSMAHFYLREYQLGLNRTPAQRAAMIESLTAADVQQVARDWQEDLCYLLAAPEPAAEIDPATPVEAQS